MPHIDINELHKESDKKNQIKIEIYNRVLSRCHTKIKSIAKLGGVKCCFFEVPEYMYGLPTYNQMDCIYYVINELLADGFQVQYGEPNTLLITWYQKPSRKTLSDITNQTHGLPTRSTKDIDYKKTSMYQPNHGSLYRDGLSEIAMKSNKLLDEFTISTPIQKEIPKYPARGPPSYKPNILNNYSNHSNQSYDSNQSSYMSNYTPDNPPTYSPNINEPFSKPTTLDAELEYKTLSFDKKNKWSSDSTYKKISDKYKNTKQQKNNRFNSPSLDQFEDDLDFFPQRANSPQPESYNNIGYSPF